MPRHFNRRTFLLGMAATAMTATSGRSLLAGTAPLFFEAASRPLGLQLYTLGDEPNKDLGAVLAQVAAIGYREVELPGLYGQTPAAIKAAADRAGLTIGSIHLGATRFGSADELNFFSEPQRIVDDLNTLGVSQAIMPMAPIPASFKPGGSGNFMLALAESFAAAGADIWKSTAEMLNEKAALLKPSGIAVGYHNHNLEFAPIGDTADNTTGWDILANAVEPGLVQFEVDTGWLGAAGIDPADFLQQYSGRVRWLHVKDLLATTKLNFTLSMEPTEIGAGKLDWKRILPAAAAAGVQHFYVEQEPPFAIPRMESITRSYQYLSQLRPDS